MARIADESGGLTIVEAVETLSSIADLDPEIDLGYGIHTNIEHVDKPAGYHTVAWLRQTDMEETLGVIRDTFKVVLRYLRGFYREEHGYLIDTHTMEGIKTIMALVGEAAKKLDYFSRLFHGVRAAKVVNLREYKLLQEFYHKRIARKVDESVLGKWVLALTPGPTNQTNSGTAEAETLEIGKRVVIDLEGVKRDTEYELFFMRKEDGTRFFSQALLRNIRLVCDFGERLSEERREDPLSRIGMWRDAQCHAAARRLIRVVGRHMDEFFHLYARNKEQELVALVSYTLMALSLAANTKNLMHNKPVKTCHRYFLDFLAFLRLALQTREYQKYAAYPPKKSHKLAWCLLDTLHTLCQGLFIPVGGQSELLPLVANLLHEAREEGYSEEASPMPWAETLATDYAAMQRLLKRHSNGPLYKILAMLKDESSQGFDPVHQDNLPNRWYDVYSGDEIMTHVRMAAPVRQETLQRAIVLDEFKGMLRKNAGRDGHGGHLLINLQDRTSLLEHARCEVSERLQDKGDFTKHLRVVTLATQTDFYLQMAPYQEGNQAIPFLKQLEEQISAEGTGYFFPPSMQQVLTESYLQDLLHGIHRVFFGERNVMLRRERLDFIELMHLLLVLKVLDVVRPATWSLTCKDGVDIGSAMSAEFYVLLKILRGAHLHDDDKERVHTMLYGPALIVRERLMIPERFQRAAGVIKAMLLAQEQHGNDGFQLLIKDALAPLFALDFAELSVHAD